MYAWEGYCSRCVCVRMCVCVCLSVCRKALNCRFVHFFLMLHVVVHMHTCKGAREIHGMSYNGYAKMLDDREQRGICNSM